MVVNYATCLIIGLKQLKNSNNLQIDVLHVTPKIKYTLNMINNLKISIEYNYLNCIPRKVFNILHYCIIKLINLVTQNIFSVYRKSRIFSTKFMLKQFETFAKIRNYIIDTYAQIYPITVDSVPSTTNMVAKTIFVICEHFSFEYS